MEARILDEFRAIVGAPGLITEAAGRSAYECDGLAVFRLARAGRPLPVLHRIGLLDAALQGTPAAELLARA